MSERTGIELTLFDEPIYRSEQCWVFGYNSAQYVRTKSFRFALGGNAPILIDRHSGELTVTGTAHSIEFYVAEHLAKKGMS